MHLMILGEHEVGRWKEIKERADRIFDNPPRGVRILHRYATINGNLTVTICEAEREEEVAEMMTELSSVSRFTIYPIYEVGEHIQESIKDEEFDAMHGPV